MILLACAASPPSGDAICGTTLPPEDQVNPLSDFLARSPLAPYPSDDFLVDGLVQIPDGALPVVTPIDDEVSEPLDLFASHPADGFSPLPTLLADFEQPLDDGDLVFLTDDPEASRLDSSPTLLLDAASGERIAHFAELDAISYPAEPRLLVLHPYVRLEEGHRYVVAIRGLRSVDGEEVGAPSGFATLRDQAGDRSWDELQARYEEEVFAVTEAAGLDRASLQLAWRFTVRSREDAVGDMLAVRSIAAAAEPGWVVDDVDRDVDAWIARRVEGRLTIPLVTEADEPGSRLSRDEAGLVRQNGTMEIEVVALVPYAALEAPARVIQYGHGFFGTCDEVDGDWGHALAAELDAVIVCVPWVGMSLDDVAWVGASLVGDPVNALDFVDRSHQAMVGQIQLAAAMKGVLATEPELQGEDGALLYDPSTVYFYGNSQGAILGGSYFAVAPEVDRAVLGVGGAGFSLMMMRALPFKPFADMILNVVEGPRQLLEFTALAQSRFDAIDPGVLAPYALQEPLDPGERRLLLQVGIGDSQVPHVAALLSARAYGVSVLDPAPEEVWGLEPVSAPADASAVTIWDYGYDAGTYADLASEENEVHGAIRASAESIAQIDAFFWPDGLLTQTCDGACDPN